MGHDIESGRGSDFSINAGGALRFRNRWCVLENEEVGKLILQEAHWSPYSVHPGVTKMYQDLKMHYWWLGMKADVGCYVAQCLSADGQSERTIQILEDILRACAVLGPDVLREVEEKVHLARQRLLTAQSKQKSYANKHRRDLEFAVGDRVFLKLKLIGAVAYRLALLPKLANVHNVFHVSNLRKYIHDPEHTLLYEPPELQEDMSYEEFPVSIIAREVRKLRNREIPYVKVWWSNHDDREATWELEDVMKEHHPHLFEESS
ncbi:uncharacterized protein LOC109711675 [Ananas comosus]|uniref:Uncharacterized protein LOC109711675 n=1 Tax=Ananas comosus TaxID=4615 RepID=A0A6P5F388_ANACO|nr:uncharacterized protein LOC109711675 [Ananas comosus]